MQYQDIKNGRFYLGDYLQVMKEIPDGVVDMILCDLPYGTTQNKWDCEICLELLWVQYNRIIKPNGAIVLTAQTPFDKKLGMSNIEALKYEWIWEKNRATGQLNANICPMKAHENVLVFYDKAPTYNPQKTTGHKPVNSYTKHSDNSTNYGKTKVVSGGGQTDRYPRSVIYFPTDKDKLHPTQKPVALFEYLIKTYTNEGEFVLDNCAGSGTTAIACENTNRRWVCIEKEQEYADKAVNRILNYSAMQEPVKKQAKEEFVIEDVPISE